MKIIDNLRQIQLEQETVLTVGAFDGLHLGHQDLLRRLVRRAKEIERLSGVVTFEPHPRAVLSPAQNAICLTTTEDKIALLQEWGLDILVILPFTQELARTSARDFVQMLVEHLRMTEMWVGWNFALGRKREADVQTLQKLGRAMGFQVHVIAPVSDGDVIISSTQIRNLLSAGHVREAAEMLGRYHALQGHVLPGTEQRKHPGSLSLNLRVLQHCAVPSKGVYAAYATIQNQRCLTVVNIGDEGNIQVHLLDFSGNPYGEKIKIEFVERLPAARPRRDREEQRPDEEDVLPAQMERYIAKAREVLQ